MFKSKLIIFNSNTLFDILYEIREKINYNLIKISKIEELTNIIDVEDNNYLLISDKKIKNLLRMNHLFIKRMKNLTFPMKALKDFYCQWF